MGDMQTSIPMPHLGNVTVSGASVDPQFAPQRYRLITPANVNLIPANPETLTVPRPIVLIAGQ